MSSPALLQVTGLGKSYRKYSSEWQRIASWFGVQTHPCVDEWVLRDVTFSITHGESIGIIGVNGAGKSTLLKIITGTLTPTEGEVHLNGSIGSILELGMGFSHEMTGRQNAFHAAGLMGIPRKTIVETMTEIERFAEVGNYFDKPLRTYSSGMNMRLAFAVATAFNPKILVVDEALSVGDAYFQHKCFARIRALKNAGTSLLLVTHDPSIVKTVCDRALLLDRGSIIKMGTPDRVLEHYHALIAEKEKNLEQKQQVLAEKQQQMRYGDRRAYIDQVLLMSSDGLCTQTFRVGEQAHIQCDIVFEEPIDSPTIGILIRDHLGNDVFGTNTFYENPITNVVKAGSRLQVLFSLPLNIGLGTYSLTVAVHAHNNHHAENYDWWDRVLIFKVFPGQHEPFVGGTYLPVSVKVVEEEHVSS